VRAWALGNLIELQMLSLLKDGNAVRSPARVERLTDKYSLELITYADQHPFEIYSTRRQIGRYKDWFKELIQKDRKSDYEAVIDLATRIHERLSQAF
jgi:hypothetical protein